jgi:hypothetical protein
LQFGFVRVVGVITMIMVSMVGLKIKSNFPVHAMKLCKGSGSITPLIRNLGNRGTWVVNYTLRPFIPVKGPQYALNRRQSRSGRSGEEKNTRPLRKVSSHFESLENRSRGLDVIWQPVRGDLTAYP